MFRNRILTLWLIATLSACVSTDNRTIERSEAVQTVLQDYAWQLPVCTWGTEQSACITIGEMIVANPYRGATISNELAALLENVNRRTPEGILNELRNTGILLSCPTTPTKPDFTTIGVQSFDPSWTQECLNIGTKDYSPTLTGTAGSRADRTIVPFSEYEESYNEYLAQCEEDNANQSAIQPLPTHGSSGNWSHLQKFLEEYRESAEEAYLQALGQEMERELDFLEALSEEREANEEFAQDPNDPEKRDEALQARAKRVQAEKNAEAARKRAEKAKEELDDAEEKADKAKDLANEADLVEDVAESNPITAIIKAIIEYIFGSDDCMVDDCAPQTCREKAQIQALRDLLKKYDKEPCNENATPIPGNEDKCYSVTSIDGSPVSAATMVDLQKSACEERKKYYGDRIDVDCSDTSRELPAFTFDACSDRLTICPIEWQPREYAFEIE